MAPRRRFLLLGGERCTLAVRVGGEELGRELVIELAAMFVVPVSLGDAWFLAFLLVSNDQRYAIEDALLGRCEALALPCREVDEALDGDELVEGVRQCGSSLLELVEIRQIGRAHV